MNPCEVLLTVQIMPDRGALNLGQCKRFGDMVWNYEGVLCVFPCYPNKLFKCVYFSANAVSSRDGLDTETGTESLLSHRRERERERARRRARETESEEQYTHDWANYQSRVRVVL